MLLLNCILLLVGTVECANILGIFATPSISHQTVFHALVKELAVRGHKLTILTTDLIKLENSNVTQIDLHNTTYDIRRKLFNFVKFKESKMSEINFIKTFYNLQIHYMDAQLSHSNVKSLIKDRSKYDFDVVIFEHLNYLTYLAFAELYDCPAIGFVSLDPFNQVHESHGNEANPMLHSEFFFPYENGKLSFRERWNSLKYYLTVKLFIDPLQKFKMKRLVEKHFPTVKSSMQELQGRIQLLMTNTNPVMGFIRPILPNTIQLGFMHIEPPKPLPEGKLKYFIDNSKNGVILMSLGSNVQSKDINSDNLNTIVQVFGSLDFDVVWKFEAETLPNKPENVMILNWLPQADLLAHPKIKLFITQGGQQSMEEAIDRMVPMVVVPFLGDQDTNAKKMVKRGIGYHLEYHTLTQGKFIEAINEMLKPKYKENIRKLRELINDQPMTSRERAVWWTEYVIRHKGVKHFQYHGTSVPLYQRLWLDFIGISTVILVVSVKLVSFIVKKMFSTFFKMKSE